MSGLRILIADDAGFIREILSNQIINLGHLVVGEAVNGQEVVDLASKRKPDIIFMDLVMPHMNGVEAAQKILEAKPSSYIVAVSSADEPFIMQQAFNVGCKEFLKKPFSKEDVLSIFNRYRAYVVGEKHA